jgi:hypothetical protein
MQACRKDTIDAIEKVEEPAEVPEDDDKSRV